MAVKGESKCPSLGARARHVRRGEPICDECRDFFNAYQRAARRGKTKRRNCPSCGGRKNRTGNEVCSKCYKNHGRRPPCGTVAGYIWHTKHLKEKACEECNEARRYSRSGPPKPQCLNPGCTTRVYTKSDYCAICKRGEIIGWLTHKGVRKPIYHRKGVKKNVQKTQAA